MKSGLIKQSDSERAYSFRLSGWERNYRYNGKYTAFAYFGGSILLFSYVRIQQYNLEIILNSRFLFQDVAIMLSGAIACLITVPVSIRCIIWQIHHNKTEKNGRNS